MNRSKPWHIYGNMLSAFPLAPFFMLIGLPAPVAQSAPPPEARLVSGSIRIQIVRAPIESLARAALSVPRALAPPSWVERKASRCVPVSSVTAISVTDSDSIDLLLNGGKRLRAHLGSDCPTLDFYSGVYVRPDRDGNICANRDWVRSRSGGQCQIQTFRALVPAR